MCKDGNLNITDGTLVCHRFTRIGDDDRCIFDIQNFLLPSCLSEIHLSIDRADTLEIFLANISERETTGQSSMLALRNTGSKAHAAHQVATIYTYREVIAMFTYLSLCCHTAQHQKHHQYLNCFHLLIFNMSHLIGYRLYLTIECIMDQL